MYGCQVMMGEERGAQIRELVERLTGEPCPCVEGRTCPLVPGGALEGPTWLQVIPAPRASNALSPA